MSVKLIYTSADGEIISVPVIAIHVPNPDWSNNLGGVGGNVNNPLIIYESYNIDLSWIPKISTESPITKTYINNNNQHILKLTYTPYTYTHFTTSKYIRVSYRFETNNGIYINDGILTYYPDGEGIMSFYSPILSYDKKNKIIMWIGGCNNTLIDLQYPTGQDYVRGDQAEYQKWKITDMKLTANTYTKYITTWKGEPIDSLRNIQLKSSDIGMRCVSNYNNFSALSRGRSGTQISYNTAYNDILNSIEIPEYPNQNPDGDNDNSGQTPSDPPIPGDGDTTSDPIPDPPAKPSFDITNTGFVVIYNPSVTEIRQLAYFMWSGEFVDLIKKMFASPFEAIISLKMLFCPVTSGNAQTVWLGNVETDVTMPKITDQFTDVDLGTVNINEFFGSFADYSPFTKIQIYLPFIGFKDLNVDEVMNSQLHLRYRIDVYTGACIAYLTVTKTIKSTNLNSILYQFDGNCAMEIPFTSNDNSRYVAAIMNSVASSALSLANTSGFTTPVAGKGFNQKAIPSTFELGSLAPVANGMLDIMSAKPNVQRAGSLSGAVSAMALKQPYIIIHRPIAQMPADYQKYLGIPLNLTRQLANVTGYTIVSQVFMSSELATDREIAMITEALKNGVIL